MRVYKRKRRINDIYSVASDVVYLVGNTFDDIFVNEDKIVVGVNPDVNYFTKVKAIKYIKAAADKAFVVVILCFFNLQTDF
jgi:hypothetical protein